MIHGKQEIIKPKFTVYYWICIRWHFWSRKIYKTAQICNLSYQKIGVVRSTNERYRSMSLIQIACVFLLIIDTIQGPISTHCSSLLTYCFIFINVWGGCKSVQIMWICNIETDNPGYEKIKIILIGEVFSRYHKAIADRFGNLR